MSEETAPVRETGRRSLGARQMMTKEERAMTAGQRLRYFFADTWWRVMWLVGAVTWCVVVNVLAISGDGDFTWWGPASVLPLLAFAAETIRRDHHLRYKQRAQ